MAADSYDRESNVVNGYKSPWREPGSWMSGPCLGKRELPWDQTDFLLSPRPSGRSCSSQSGLVQELNSPEAYMWDDHHKFFRDRYAAGTCKERV